MLRLLAAGRTNRSIAAERVAGSESHPSLPPRSLVLLARSLLSRTRPARSEGREGLPMRDESSSPAM
ncbi:hypothetical protein ACFVHW_18345 [Streptomyces sp. NPDC127110]|uniref:hypothetical protein n=1 Tax=Streptomyces sp. NPDC127110 TaxID=3345362 RepID=UPI0036404AB9